VFSEATPTIASARTKPETLVHACGMDKPTKAKMLNKKLYLL